MEKFIVLELTEEEFDMVMKKREADAKQVKLEGYVAELNDLIVRASADGFVIATNGPHRLLKAEPWNNPTKDFIRVCTT